jgi:hypothetical protein
MVLTMALVEFPMFLQSVKFAPWKSTQQNAQSPNEYQRFGVNDAHGISQEPLDGELISEGFGP